MIFHEAQHQLQSDTLPDTHQWLLLDSTPSLVINKPILVILEFYKMTNMVTLKSAIGSLCRLHNQTLHVTQIIVTWSFSPVSQVNLFLQTNALTV